MGQSMRGSGHCDDWFRILGIGTGVLLAWLGLCAPAAAGEIRGSLQLLSNGKPLRAEEAVEAVVYFRPDAPFAAPAALPLQQMATRDKTFLPRVLPITVGTEVGFPNLDAILHNAFSHAPGNDFDTGSYGSGEGSRHRFNQAGVVEVFCNVHHAMSAKILVLDTPWFTRPDAQGRFYLQGLPDGSGELLVFHDRAALWQQRLEVGATAIELAVPLQLIRRKVPPHMNKFGEPYKKPRRGRY
jgi:plastocyanin